jgi:hypothetical protein
MFGLEREIIVIFSDYEIFQARSIDAIDKLLESVLDRYESMRVERVCSILFSKDDLIRDKIRAILRETQLVESQVVIPFSYSEIGKTENFADEYFLVNRFKDCFYSRDLFNFTSPLRKELYFFGRIDLINKLGNRHFSHENSSVFGLRRSGKTSLIFAVQRYMDKFNCPSVFIACDKPAFHQRRWNECLHYILKVLVDNYKQISAKKMISPVEQYTEKDAPLIFESDLVNIHKKLGGKPILFIFDEIETITFNTALDEHWRQGNDFVLLWRSLKSAFNSLDSVFSYLIVGTNPACIETYKFADGTKENPIFNSTSVEYIDRFDTTDTRDMVEKLGSFMGLEFEESIYSRLAEDYGGHPFLLRQVCSSIYQRYKGGFSVKIDRKNEKNFPIKVDSIMYAEAKVEFESSKALGYVKLILAVLTEFYPQELTMLTFLATEETDFFNSMAEDSSECIDHLIGYGIISKKLSGIGYDFRIDAVKSYLQNENRYQILHDEKSKEKDKEREKRIRLEVLQTITDLEIVLREIVRTNILGRYGVQMACQVVIEVLKSNNRVDTMHPLVYKDLFNPDKVKFYFLTLKSLIIKEWGIFAEIFEDATRFGQTMESLNKFRNTAAHSGVISTESCGIFREDVKWIKKQIAEWKKKTG